MNLNWFIYEGNIIKTLKYTLKLSDWKEKEINNNLNFKQFIYYLKNNLNKRKITYEFIWWTIFWSIYPNFPENKLLKRYIQEFKILKTHTL